MTFEQLEQKIFQNSLNTCHYLGGYENSQSDLLVHCDVHDLDFKTNYQNVNRANRAHHICPKCQDEDRENKKTLITLTCDYCGKEFQRRPSKIDSSKKGFHFCCREHKDLAQRLDSGEKFKELRPDHYYNQGSSSYRKRAFHEYPHKCNICGWDEDEEVLQVHHLDGNRSNNDISNLMILCPTCHAKLTIGKYEIVNNKIELKREI